MAFKDALRVEAGLSPHETLEAMKEILKTRYKVDIDQSINDLEEALSLAEQHKENVDGWCVELDTRAKQATGALGAQAETIEELDEQVRELEVEILTARQRIEELEVELDKARTAIDANDITI